MKYFLAITLCLVFVVGAYAVDNVKSSGDIECVICNYLVKAAEGYVDSNSTVTRMASTM